MIKFENVIDNEFETVEDARKEIANGVFFTDNYITFGNKFNKSFKFIETYGFYNIYFNETQNYYFAQEIQQENGNWILVQDIYNSNKIWSVVREGKTFYYGQYINFETNGYTEETTKEFLEDLLKINL